MLKDLVQCNSTTTDMFLLDLCVVFKRCIFQCLFVIAKEIRLVI